MGSQCQCSQEILAATITTSAIYFPRVQHETKKLNILHIVYDREMHR